MTTTYALLTRESSNRVYGRDAARLLVAELAAVAPHFSVEVSNIAIETLGGVDYVLFDAGELNGLDCFFASNLSGTRAFFAADEGLLRPLSTTPLTMFAEDIVTIQRYPGKTNEQFTHLLVNLATAASSSAHARVASGERVRLLDPVAGRGSTLNRALMYGFDAYGVELNSGDVDQYRQFLSTYLKTNRVKHKVTAERFRKGELAGDSAFDVDIGRGRQAVRMVNGETSRARSYFRGRQMDVIVGDLPYGVHHGATTGRTLRRSPKELVESAVASWAALLSPGGAIGLSFNTKTLSPADVTSIFTHARLAPVDHPVDFTHTVDRSITRGLLVATKEV